MKFNVTDIEFDFDDGNLNEEEYKLTFDEEIEIRDLALGVWDAEDEDDMIDEITTATGYLIKNIYYDIQLKWQFQLMIFPKVQSSSQGSLVFYSLLYYFIL